ncbi:unnamed protein product, partial [marine sediment metagenome]
MTVWATTAILLGGLLVILAIGTEIAVGIGIMAAIGILLFTDQPLQQFLWTAFNETNSFTLTAVPLFVFMGTMFANTGVVRKLFSGVDKLLGSLSGGLAMTVIGSSAVFGAMSGSSIAAAATFGKISFPEMEEQGYNHRLALGSIAMGGTLSVLIPPSIILVVYGQWLNVSVSRLFAAALIPGVIFALLLMLTVWVRVKLNPSLAPRSPSYGWRVKLLAIKEISPWLGIIILVLGVIFGGIMTPTEAASLGAFLGIAVALAYRQMSFRALKDSALTALKISAMLALVVMSARMLAHVFLFTGFTEEVSSFMLGLPFGKYGT